MRVVIRHLATSSAAISLWLGFAAAGGGSNYGAAQSPVYAVRLQQSEDYVDSASSSLIEIYQ